jgi:hypothetical protein
LQSHHQVTAFCLNWHITTSKSIFKILISPLAKLGLMINPVPWDGNRIPGNISNGIWKHPVLFFQLPPPKRILDNKYQHIVWAPMWDHAQGYNLTWWSGLPKNIRVIAFSDLIYQKAESAGLEVLRIQYAPPPQHNLNINWKEPLTAFYWNRTGLFSKELIIEICNLLNVRRLIFQYKLDPRIPKGHDYRINDQYPGLKVETFSEHLADEAYIDLQKQAHIYFAPRKTEGVGLTFLDAMATGSFVIANNAPTMNEYIVHRIHGYLINRNDLSLLQKANLFINSYLLKDPKTVVSKNHYLNSQCINFKSISLNELEIIGNSAKQRINTLHQQWCIDLPKLKSFLCDW